MVVIRIALIVKDSARSIEFFKRSKHKRRPATAAAAAAAAKFRANHSRLMKPQTGCLCLKVSQGRQSEGLGTQSFPFREAPYSLAARRSQLAHPPRLAEPRLHTTPQSSLCVGKSSRPSWSVMNIDKSVKKRTA